MLQKRTLRCVLTGGRRLGKIRFGCGGIVIHLRRRFLSKPARWVIARAAQRMTAPNAVERKNKPLHGTVFTQCLLSVRRARRVEAAAGRGKRRDSRPVDPQHAQQHVAGQPPEPARPTKNDGAYGIHRRCVRPSLPERFDASPIEQPGAFEMGRAAVFLSDVLEREDYSTRTR